MRLFFFKEKKIVADVIACPVLIGHPVFQMVAHTSEKVDSLENGQRVRAATTQIVHFAAARPIVEREEQGRHIVAMNLVANLLPLVPVYRVLTPCDGTTGDVSEIAVEFHRGVLRSR